MNLSIPTVTKLISELQEDGYILDFGKQETSGGRKPSIYGLNPVSGYFVGVDILKDQLNLAILDFKGDKIRIEQNIPYTLENTPAALDHLCECINEFINSLPIPREKILSIGINISGRVNPFAGYSYSIFYFEEKPLSQILEEKLLANMVLLPSLYRSRRVRYRAEPEAPVSRHPFLPQWQRISFSKKLKCPNSPEKPDFPK
jgi:hypothetical protein